MLSVKISLKVALFLMATLFFSTPSSLANENSNKDSKVKNNEKNKREADLKERFDKTLSEARIEDKKNSVQTYDIQADMNFVQNMHVTDNYIRKSNKNFSISRSRNLSIFSANVLLQIGNSEGGISEKKPYYSATLFARFDNESAMVVIADCEKKAMESMLGKGKFIIIAKDTPRVAMIKTQVEVLMSWGYEKFVNRFFRSADDKKNLMPLRKFLKTLDDKIETRNGSTIDLNNNGQVQCLLDQKVHAE